jgi:hypothetical protein
MEEEKYNKYKVYYHTIPFPGGTYYDGQIDVYGSDTEDAEYRAKLRLTNKYDGVFFDRGFTGIKVDKIIIIEGE